jgi:hypothetical protein
VQPPEPSDVRLEGDFSLSLWVDVPAHMAGSAGGLASKWDPATRTGFNLSAISSSGGYNGPGEELRISSGIDAGSEPRWIDCGRPSATSNHVTSLTVFDGMLYTGSTDARSESEFAHVFRYQGGTDWEDLGQVSPNGERGVGPLVVHDGALYAATWNHDWTRVTYLAHAPCRVFRFDGAGSWVDCGQPGVSKRIFAMATYKGDLYAAGDDETIHVYRGGQDWELVEQLPTFVHPMTVHAGRMAVGTWERPPTVLRHDGSAWEDLGNPLGDRRLCSQLHSLIVFDGALHAGSWPLGNVSRYEEGDRRWIDLGRMGDSTEVNGLAAYNGKLYAGALPRAEVFRHDGGTSWRSIRRFHSPPGWDPVAVEDMERPPDGDLRMREWARVTSLTEHDGLLFATVTSCTGSVIDAPADVRGSVHAMRAGVVATSPRSLTPGRHHVAAVRDGDRLSVFVDGRVAASTAAALHGSPVTSAPLTVGRGVTGPFGGQVSGFQAFDRALTLRELGGLASQPGPGT